MTPCRQEQWSKQAVYFSNEKESRIDHIEESTEQRPPLAFVTPANTYEQTRNENNPIVEFLYARIQRTV